MSVKQFLLLEVESIKKETDKMDEVNGFFLHSAISFIETGLINTNEDDTESLHQAKDAISFVLEGAAKCMMDQVDAMERNFRKMQREMGAISNE